MSLGAFLGGAADGFSKTYKMLSEEEERELIKQERRERMERERQARQAAADTLGRANTQILDQAIQTGAGVDSGVAKTLDQQNASFGPEAYQDATRKTISAGQYAAGAPKSAIPDRMEGRLYKESEAMGDYARRLAAIDPDKAITASVQGRQLKQLERTEKMQADFDKSRDGIRDNIIKMQGAAESGNLDAFMDLAKKNGLDIRKATDPKTGALTMSLYENGKVVGTANSLSDAVNQLAPLYMAQQAEKFSLLFANDPTQFFRSVMDIRTDRRAGETLGLAKNKDAREEAEAPLKRATERAKANQYDAYSEYLRDNKGKKPAKEVTNKDVLDFIKEMGESPSGIKDPKTGRDLRIAELPAADQRRLAIEFYTGTGGSSGLPDIGDGGLKKPGAPAPAPAGAAPAPTSAIPTRTGRGETVGILTPNSRLAADLAAGDPATRQYVDEVLKSTYGAQRLPNDVVEAAARAGSSLARRELEYRSQLP